MTDFPALVQRFLLRELASVRDELARYPDEDSLWAMPAGLPNSGGTLALHLAGNLQHFVGAKLGETGYIRERDREFSDRDVPLERILKEIDAAEAAVRHTLPRLTKDDLDREYPEAVADVRFRTGDYLMQLAVHLAYHLGQLSYHRRVVTGDSEGVGAVAVAALGGRSGAL